MSKKKWFEKASKVHGGFGIRSSLRWLESSINGWGSFPGMLGQDQISRRGRVKEKIECVQEPGLLSNLLTGMGCGRRRKAVDSG